MSIDTETAAGQLFGYWAYSTPVLRRALELRYETEPGSRPRAQTAEQRHTQVGDFRKRAAHHSAEATLYQRNGLTELSTYHQRQAIRYLEAADTLLTDALPPEPTAEGIFEDDLSGRELAFAHLDEHPRSPLDTLAALHRDGQTVADRRTP